MISIVVPTRRRVASLRRLLASLDATAADRRSFEVVLVTDDDDPDTAAFAHRGPRAVGPAFRTMAELNLAGVAASRGEFVMLLNDDVVARTPGWDRALLHHARRFADGVVLVHVNDTLMRDNLCVFPMLSRRYVDRVGLCDPRYRRYRIDDHVEDVFLRLAALGERRIVYLPDVVFEHLNAVEVNGVREYHAPPDALAPDAELFDALAEQRQLAANTLFAAIQLERLEGRIAAAHGPARYDRTPRVVCLPTAGPATLNRQVAAAESDFIVVGGPVPADWMTPRTEAVIHQRGVVYLDRARVGHAPFDERYGAYLFDIDLALRHGAAIEPGPAAWAEGDYAADLALFRATHDVAVGPPPAAPSLLGRAMNCWRRGGISGVLAAILRRAATTPSGPRPAAASAARPAGQ